MNFDIPTLTEVTIDDLEALSVGAGILGTGGGGNPRLGKLRLKTLFEDSTHPDAVEVVQATDLPKEATVVSVGGIGAPTIGVEKFLNGNEQIWALDAIERFSGQNVDALIPGEIGGVNSLVPLYVGGMMDLPVVDADGMGRAFPEIQMSTFYIYGQEVNYSAISDERKNTIVYEDIDSPKRLEKFKRAATIEMGGIAGSASPLMKAGFIREFGIGRTLSLIRELGQQVLDAGTFHRDPVGPIYDVVGGESLFEGKITDIYRRNRAGFARGEVTLTELDGDSSLNIEFQNEFLVARDENDDILASVPDLISIVEKGTGLPITTDSLRYGQRVTVLGIPAPDLLTTDRALEVVGPQAFGFEFNYQPLAESS